MTLDQNLKQELQSALEQEQKILLAELNAIAKPPARGSGEWSVAYPQFEEDETGSHASRDEEADEVEEYEQRLGVERALHERLASVSAALERIPTDAYGVCGYCEKDIPLERLRANPSARYHIEHEPVDTERVA